MSKAALLARATRAKTLPVMLMPVCVGAALAWNKYPYERCAKPVCAQVLVPHPFAWGWFLVTLLGAAALHLGANVLNDYYDERSGADKLARMDRTAIVTGTSLIESGEMTSSQVLGLAAALFTVALACGVVLSLARGWTVFALGALGAFLAWQYVAPPVKYGYRGRGLGELGIFAAFGLLPVAGSYYVQTQHLDRIAFEAAIVPGLLTTLVLYHHHFLHWRADKAAGKMTPVAALEPERAMTAGGIAIVATYVILIVEAIRGVYPWGALLALVSAVPLLGQWARAKRDGVVQNHLQLLGATLGASVLTGTAISLSLVIARALR